MQLWPLIKNDPLKLSSYLLPKFSRVPFTIVLISLISNMVNGTLLNFAWEIWRWFRGHFWSVAKVALRFGCTKQSENLERYLVNMCIIKKCDNHLSQWWLDFIVYKYLDSKCGFTGCEMCGWVQIWEFLHLSFLKSATKCII